MKKTTFLLLVFCLGFTCNSIAQTPQDIAHTHLKEIVNNKYVVGISAGFIVNEKTMWTGADGYSDRASKTVFNVDTEVRIASIAKSMTAIAVMQLVEQGKIDLDIPIDEYIPEFIQNGKTKITTRHILSHTSGIDAYKGKKEFENTTHYNSLLEAYSVFKDRKLKFEPGTQYYYTTYGYVVLGILIEKVSKQSFEDYMQERIWDKAKMTQTGFDKFGERRPRTSKLYHREKKSKLKDAKENDLSNRIPGGGFYSTVGDLLKFGVGLLENTFVKEETLKLMTTHHSLEKVNNSYGFGFFLYGKQPDAGSIFGHSGAQTGSSTQFFVIPSLNAVTVAISNTSGAGKNVSNLAGTLIGLAKDLN